MKHHLLGRICLVLTAICCWQNIRAADMCCVSIAVEMSSSPLVAGQPTLRVSLKNTGNQPLTMYRSALPWGNRYSIAMLAAPPNAQPLELVFPIDDPSVDEVEVKPGESLTGTIRLSMFFRAVGTALEKASVTVLWSYQLRTVDDKLSQRIAGQVVLPQQRK
jgi:hypothetical protein